MNNLCGVYTYLNVGNEKANVTSLYLNGNRITSICDELSQSLITHSTVRNLGLARNNFSEIPSRFNSVSNKLEKIWLGENPIQCKCEMVWLIEWLTKGLVQDYEEVICTQGRNIGTPVYKLDAVHMKCYPRNVPIWFVIVCSAVTGCGLILAALMIGISYYWNIIRWIIYDKFDKIVGDPYKNEDITDKVFDVFLTYR